MANWLDYFFGGKQPQIVPPYTPPSSYPTQADAAEAIKQGYGYGSGNEDYIAGQRANLYPEVTTGSSREAVNAPVVNTDLSQFRSLADLNKINTLYAQGALASNRSPIASLGFDPRRTGLQTNMGPATLGGAYDKKTDRLWVNVEGNQHPSAVTHESIHRGLTRMSDTSEAATEHMSDKEKALAEEAKKLLEQFPDQETIVRHMMQTQMGDPELDIGDESDRQRAKSAQYFLNDRLFYSEDKTKKLARLEELAAEMRKNRRPGGPR